MTNFKPVSSQVDFPALEKEILEYWQKNGIVEKYLKRNSASEKKFSFLDGPITANNPMGVHHAWGRTYKDLWQRFYNMRGFRQRFQNGFDEQGLWVEVGVEQELGLKSKKDIENLIAGDKFASLEKFVNLCKERVKKYGDIMTDQSERLGYFMDWDNSYHTSSEQNNYTIWHFLKTVYEKGWLYKGRDSVPWCPRCGTAISQHEISTEEYKELSHQSVYFKLPIKDRDNEYLLVWTTTPWTIPADVAVAVNEKEQYISYQVGDEKVWIMEGTMKRLQENGVLLAQPAKGEVTEQKFGKGLVGWEYVGPFDDLQAVKNAFGDYRHRVVATDPLILPISDEEGTGLVHIAPGAGAEDYALGKKGNLPVVAPIDEAAVFVEGFGELGGLGVKEVIQPIIEHLEKNNFLFKTQQYTHRYPTCWRCKTELVWRVVDEWYIAVDKKDPVDDRTYREKMLEVVKEIKWQPKFVEKREFDWLRNLHDWLISKKRYWGLALPIWECSKCGNFEVIGGEEELQERSVAGWEKFEGHTPHRPWIDGIKIKCLKCSEVMSRVPDVGNPWLDAGIVPYSTITEKDEPKVSYLTDKKYWQEWFPPKFAVEMYEQTKLWFYAMIAMSSALENKVPVQRIFGHGRVVDEKGEEMHRSKGNAIWFDEAAEKMGVDVMRWLYLAANPGEDLRFGYNLGNEVKRRFLLILWNCYKFFIDYATLADWSPKENHLLEDNKILLDRWILARLNELAVAVNTGLEKYDAASSSRAIDDFVVNDLSTWYIRRSRGRVGPAADQDDEQAFLSTTYQVLVTLSKLLAPFMPFIAEEIYRNLTGEESVHLADYPQADEELIDKKLIEGMSLVRKFVEVGHALRKEANIKLRQPLSRFYYNRLKKLPDDLEKILADELNVKVVEAKQFQDTQGFLDTKITPALQAEGEVRELIRQIQSLRKESGLTLKDKIKIVTPAVPEKEEFVEMILKQTNATTITQGEKLSLEVVK